jgi:Carboxypeptidase regulatory-like domain
MKRLGGWLAIAALGSAVALMGNSPALGQAGANQIVGTVIDSDARFVTTAQVTAVNTDTGVKVEGHTDQRGAYKLEPIVSGPYVVEVVAKGFSRVLKENVDVGGVNGRPVVDARQTVRLDIRLEANEQNMSVTITVPPPYYPRAATVPLFRDPIHDGAADPVVVWNRERKSWWMFYTNRRADLDDNSGVTWVHGTRIGIAESADGGANWKYVSEADIPVAAPDYTLWAPEVIDVHGMYHMFLTVVPGTFTDWNHPRHIQHLTSTDLLHWKPVGDVNLPSDRTIDPCVFLMPNGQWRLWYKDEADHSNVHFSDSPDLVHWAPVGIATRNGGEGPVVFEWRGAYWLINDPHRGLGVFRSTDLTTWTQQPDNLLREPGTQPTDHAVGNHADVVVDRSGHAWLFYFTQQGGENASPNTRGNGRRSVLHVTELHEKDGVLTADRNAPAYIHMLPPPQNKKSDMAKVW